MVLSGDISISSDFKTGSTFFEVPAISSKCWRNGSSSIVFCTILVIARSDSEGIGMAISVFPPRAEATPTSTKVPQVWWRGAPRYGGAVATPKRRGRASDQKHEGAPVESLLDSAPLQTLS